MLKLREKDRCALVALCDKHLPPDTQVLAYGSRVNGDCHDGSDLDLVVRTKSRDTVGIDELENLINAVCDSTIPILVEIRDWARLPESFHGEIEKNCVVLWGGK